MEINPNEMAATQTPQKPELKWLHDFKSSFRELELVYRQHGFEEVKKLLHQTPLKTVGEYYSDDKIIGFKEEFVEGILSEIRENTYWINVVDNQIYSVNHSKSPEEFEEAFQKLKQLF